MAKKRHTLEGFTEYLTEFDLDGGTIDGYVSDVRRALDAGGLIKRLRDQDAAPKSRRRYLAAFRKWADYTDDAELTKALKRVRLPPPGRKTVKVPLQKTDLEALVAEIATCKDIGEPVRGVLGLLACRGLRCGDALRLQRDQVEHALSSGVLLFVAKGRRRLEFRVLKTYRRYLEILHRAFEGSRAQSVAELVSPRAKPEGRSEAAARRIERMLVRVGVRCGVRGLYPHRLRRTYAVEYLKSMPGDPEALVKLKAHMQWAQMETALQYVDFVRGEDLDAPALRIFERHGDA